MKYLIVEKEKGVFLGAYRSIHLFAKDNIFPIIKAPSFDTQQLAEFYIAQTFSGDGLQYGVIEIDSKDKYVSLVEIIKQGYAEYTHDLIDNLPMISEKFH